MIPPPKGGEITAATLCSGSPVCAVRMSWCAELSCMMWRWGVGRRRTEDGGAARVDVENILSCWQPSQRPSPVSPEVGPSAARARAAFAVRAVSMPRSSSVTSFWHSDSHQPPPSPFVYSARMHVCCCVCFGSSWLFWHSNCFVTGRRSPLRLLFNIFVSSLYLSPPPVLAVPPSTSSPAVWRRRRSGIMMHACGGVPKLVLTSVWEEKVKRNWGLWW